MCQQPLPPELKPLWDWLAEALPAVTAEHEKWEIILTGHDNLIETLIRVTSDAREHPNQVTRTTTIQRPIVIRPRLAKVTTPAIPQRLTVK